MKKQVMIKIVTKRFAISQSLFDEVYDQESTATATETKSPEENNSSKKAFALPPDEHFDSKPKEDDEEQESEFYTVGTVERKNGRICFSYEENVLSGMEGSATSISFDTKEPELVTMLRGGPVVASLVFEPQRRHHCVYETLYMPLTVCVHTLRVVNRIVTEGTLLLEYIVEIRGAEAEHCQLRMMVMDDDKNDSNESAQDKDNKKSEKE